MPIAENPDVVFSYEPEAMGKSHEYFSTFRILDQYSEISKGEREEWTVLPNSEWKKPRNFPDQLLLSEN